MRDNTKLLLCSDLDRTLIPNGHQEESPDARYWLGRLAQRPEVMLVYVSGRDKALITEAIRTWELPLPDIAVGDVGTAIYTIGGKPEKPVFEEWEDWKQEIAADWNGKKSGDIVNLFRDFKVLSLQEDEKQKDFKLSFYVDIDADLSRITENIKARLAENRLRSSVIDSIDEIEDVALVDIVPERATKIHAVYFIMNRLQIERSRVIYAGDSGNDLLALTSGLKAVLVKNASEDVCREAIEIVSQKADDSSLYLAEGGFMEMNGNYAAGVLEGVVHFMPEVLGWLQLDKAEHR
jgi:sucrose-6-phosphatase